MTKMLIISSDTPEEDVQAAFTIVREAQNDSLDKITWYSNFARSIVRFDERISAIEKDFKMFAEAYNRFGIETRAQFERITKVEKEIVDLKKPPKEKKT